MRRYRENVELFRGDPLDGLNPEPPETMEVLTGEPAHSPAVSVEAVKDTVENGQEEKMDRLMKSISEFIRKIDVTAL